MEDLTKRQEEYLENIKKFIRTNKYSPSVREIGEMVNCTSSASIFGMLRNLQKKGAISFVPRISRSIVVLEETDCEA